MNPLWALTVEMLLAAQYLERSMDRSHLRWATHLRQDRKSILLLAETCGEWSDERDEAAVRQPTVEGER